MNNKAVISSSSPPFFTTDNLMIDYFRFLFIGSGLSGSGITL